MNYSKLSLKSKYLFLAMRPRQWTKNLLVFTAPFFSFKFESDIWLGSFSALIAFCLISSCIYLINDCLDVESDRKHPHKRFRPLASGKISTGNALFFSMALFLIGIYIAITSSLLLFYILLAYVLIHLGYCLYFKKIPILDLFCISSGFLLRCFAGGASSNLYLSPWFILSVGLLALFIAVEKRKSELILIQETGVLTRSVLGKYSLEILVKMENLVATSAFMTYALWAAGSPLDASKKAEMLITVPFVMMGIFRYQLLMTYQHSNKNFNKVKNFNFESPEEIFLNDKFMQLIVIFWLIVSAIIGLLYF